MNKSYSARRTRCPPEAIRQTSNMLDERRRFANLEVDADQREAYGEHIE
jgi:hypothetical protein